MLQNFTLGTFSQGASGGAGAFESIASATGSGVSTVTFSSIPATYQSLHLRVFALNPTTGGFRIRLNGDTASANYVTHDLIGNGASVTAASYVTNTAGFRLVWSSTSTTAGLPFILDLHDYASITKNKTARWFAGHDQNAGTTDGFVSLSSGLWLNTAAVNSISVFSTAGNYLTGSTFALYGIKGA
jgi:hypothetical protein